MTTKGMYNPKKVNKEHEKLVEKLNNHELSMLVHKLVEDKRYFVKTVDLIKEQLKTM